MAFNMVKLLLFTILFLHLVVGESSSDAGVEMEYEKKVESEEGTLDEVAKEEASVAPQQVDNDGDVPRTEDPNEEVSVGGWRGCIEDKFRKGSAGPAHGNIRVFVSDLNCHKNNFKDYTITSYKGRSSFNHQGWSSMRDPSYNVNTYYIMFNGYQNQAICDHHYGQHWTACVRAKSNTGIEVEKCCNWHARGGDCHGCRDWAPFAAFDHNWITHVKAIAYCSYNLKKILVTPRWFRMSGSGTVYQQTHVQGWSQTTSRSSTTGQSVTNTQSMGIEMEGVSASNSIAITEYAEETLESSESISRSLTAMMQTTCHASVGSAAWWEFGWEGRWQTPHTGGEYNNKIYYHSNNIVCTNVLQVPCCQFEFCPGNDGLCKGCSDNRYSMNPESNKECTSAEQDSSAYSETSGQWCRGYHGNYGSSFNNAKNACNSDGSCVGIYSSRCSKNNYKLCRSSGSWSSSSIGSCVFKKAAGTEATVGFPQMNVVKNENAVAMTNDGEMRFVTKAVRECEGCAQCSWNDKDMNGQANLGAGLTIDECMNGCVQMGNLCNYFAYAGEGGHCHTFETCNELSTGTTVTEWDRYFRTQGHMIQGHMIDEEQKEEILAECFGEELDDSQIQVGSEQEKIINVNNTMFNEFAFLALGSLLGGSIAIFCTRKYRKEEAFPLLENEL